MTGPLVVLGDALLDIDLVGRAERLCPDAPVPVLDQIVEHPRPGGAALAAVLAADDGADVVLVAPFADDEAGRQLRALVEPRVRVLPLPLRGGTSVKRRVRSGGQSMLRLDSGDGRADVDAVPAEVRRVLAEAGGVLVSDYGRGVTTSPALRDLLAETTVRVPVVWDPHPRGGMPVPGVRLVTPNAAEAVQFADRAGTMTDRDGTDLAGHSARASGLARAWEAHAVALTLGARGALLSYGRGTPMVLPAPAVQGQDACGAGDRFASTAARLLAAGTVTSEAVQSAVDSASVFVACGGAAGLHQPDQHQPDQQRPHQHQQAANGGDPASDDAVTVARRVRDRRGVVVATGGCFDLLHAGHVASLRAARRLGDCLVVCLNSDASVRRLKGPSRPLVPAADRVRVLEALECVDAVLVFEEDTPVQALRSLRPDLWAKGGDYATQELPETTVLEEWGGQAVALPYVPGRSTTELVQSAAAPHRRTASST